MESKTQMVEGQGKISWKWNALNATGVAWKNHHQSVFEKHGKGLHKGYSEEHRKCLRNSNRNSMPESPITSKKMQSSALALQRKLSQAWLSCSLGREVGRALVAMKAKKKYDT